MDQETIKTQINEWYHKYSNALYKYIFFMTGEHEQTKDLLQETFLRAYKNYESYKGSGEKNWLFRIARNLTIDYIRKKPVSYSFDPETGIQDTDKTPEEIILLNESERALYIALRHIKSSYREVIILRKIRGFTINESSQILGWSVNKVKVTLFRGLKALKKELEKEGNRDEII